MLSPLRRSGFDVKAKQVELLRRCLKKGEKEWQVWLRSYPELTGAASRLEPSPLWRLGATAVQT